MKRVDEEQIRRPGESSRPSMPATPVACRVCSDAGYIHIDGQPEVRFYRDILRYCFPCSMQCDASKPWVKEFDCYQQELALLGPEIAGTDATGEYWWGGKLYADKAEVQRLAREWRAKGGRIG